MKSGLTIEPYKGRRTRKTASGRAKKQNMSEFLRQWHMPPYIVKTGKEALRYKNPPEKGVYWYWFSLEVRQRDVTKYGTCISCGRLITVDTCDAGHFMPAADCGRDLLFAEKNVNAECSYCNAWDSTHLLGYAEGLDRRYGLGTATKLREERALYKAGSPIKDWKATDYAEKTLSLNSYQAALITL